jgi:hypothetical protein
MLKCAGELEKEWESDERTVHEPEVDPSCYMGLRLQQKLNAVCPRRKKSQWFVISIFVVGLKYDWGTMLLK